MSTPKTTAALGAAAFALGLSLAGPLTAGIASADPADPTNTAAESPANPPRGAKRAESVRAVAKSSPSSASAPRAAAAVERRADRVVRPAAPAAQPRAALSVDSVLSSPGEAGVPVGARTTSVPGVYRAASAAAVPLAAVRAPVPAPAAATAQVSSPAAATASAVTGLFSGLYANPISDFINGIMLMVRRRFFNQAPSAVPVQAMVGTDNQVWGFLRGSDPEGDRITYTLSRAPLHGSVSISDRGVYTYVPGKDFTGTDSFTVTVADVGFHINLLNLFGGNRRQVAVSVRAADPAGTVIDNFDGAAGSAPDPALWTRNTGAYVDSGIQTYTDSPDNVRLDGQGHLVIEALDSPGGYTSGEVITRGKLNMTYGSMTARIKIPSGQGIWPAFWMLGSTYSFDTWYAQGPTGWPGCGEIDVIETINSGANYYVALHGPQGVPSTNSYGDYYTGTASGQFVGASGSISAATGGRITDLAAGYHDYWVIRDRDIIVIGVDDTMLATLTPDSLPPGGLWVFNQPMYAILNVAVGGSWPGPPDDTTPWPATMLVDSFRYTPTPAV